MSKKSKLLAMAVLSLGLLAIVAVIGTGQAHSSAKADETDPKESHGRKPIPPPEVLKKLPPDGGSEYNRLVFEKSPYLLQHAGNPVDWYPWGEEGFEKARKENKPIFLSVGYSTCHWCHVMERESFENPNIAAVMNKYFVNIKVDREERPDVDKVYMTFVQATTGGGGWPMSVWLTPDLEPFVGGTYFPPEDRWGRVGFKTILERIGESWRKGREQIVATGNSVIAQLKQVTAVGGNEVELTQALLEEGYRRIKASYEPNYGGFGSAPKFPRPVAYNFMLRYYARTDTQGALDMTLFTLRRMAGGGMHDHIGGGFHRYSTDDRWHVPHFEKMLYDQAQLVWSYLEAYQITDDALFADVARDILEYVSRDMTGDRGQFYSAEDADSPKPEDPSEQAEGAFYVWEKEETEAILGAENAAVFNHYYTVRKGGNVQRDPHGEFPNKNVLIVSLTLEETANRFDKTVEEIEAILAGAREKLFHVREKRPRPHLDDKTITAWNGLMISAYARAYQVLGDEKYREAAERATAFIRSKLYDKQRGILLRRYRAGEASIDGFVDDYAFFIQGLLDLYEASFDIQYLTWAIELQKKQDALFWDAASGGYFSTTGQDDSILLRMKNDYDGAEPSPNSVAALNLLRLAQMTDSDRFRQYADKTLAAFSSRLKQVPHAMPQMLVAFDFQLDKPKQIIIAGKPDAQDTRAMLSAVHATFIPNKILLLADAGPGQETLARHVAFIESVNMIDGKATAYVCENYVCQLPTAEIDTMVRLLKGQKVEPKPTASDT